MQTRLSFSFFTLSLLALFLPPLLVFSFPLSLFFAVSRISPRSHVHSSAFFLSISLALSLIGLFCTQTQTPRAERESSAKSAGDWHVDWPLADHVADPTDSRLCSPLAAFSHAGFRRADCVRMRLRACVVRACYARTRAQKRTCVLAYSFPRSVLLLLALFRSRLAPIARTPQRTFV